MTHSVSIRHRRRFLRRQRKPFHANTLRRQTPGGWGSSADRHKELISKTVHGAADACGATVEHVCVDHGRLHVTVTEQFLHGADVVSGFDQMRGEGMPKRVTKG